MGKNRVESGSHPTANERWQKKLRALEEKVEYYHQHRLVPEYKPRLTEPLYFWKIFFRQKDALERAILATEDVHVFAFEPEGGSPGKRRYLVTSYPQMWHSIQSLYAIERPGTFYEIITEGAVCKLYFDLEFLKQYNPDHNGEGMVAKLIQIASDKLHTVFNIHCSSKDVLVLDASTEAKFSCHLIFNLRNAAFKDNINVGYFVHQLCSEITESESKNGNVPCKKPRLEEKAANYSLQREQSLSISNAEGKQSLFIDQGVYTRNRNFRLYKCVKLEKDNPLLVAEYGSYEPRMGRRERISKEKKIFMDSLITNIKCIPETRILTFADNDERPRPSRVLELDPCPGPTQQGLSTTERSSSEQSLFTELDEFIVSVVTEGGVQGAIRQGIYFSESSTVLYEIFKNRWCGNIGRAHKSNNIMILVNLKRRTFYQKCHDPDCKGYKSEESPLPADILPVTDDYNDDELLEALDKVENNEDINSPPLNVENGEPTKITENNGNINTPSLNVENEGSGSVAEENDLFDAEDFTDEELNRTYDSLTETGNLV